MCHLHQAEKTEKEGIYLCSECGKKFFIDKDGCLKEMMGNIKFKTMTSEEVVEKIKKDGLKI